MNHTGASLSEFFRLHAQRGEALALATIVETAGSTYRKSGAQMLIAADGQAAGLLSGGCLESDLMEHARVVIATGRAARIEYDTRSSDDPIWGIGLGCEGAMSILLTRIDPANCYQPFAFAEDCRRRDAPGRFALIVSTQNPEHPLGAAFWSEAAEQAPPPIARALRQGLDTHQRQPQGLDTHQAAEQHLDTHNKGLDTHQQEEGLDTHQAAEGLDTHARSPGGIADRAAQPVRVEIEGAAALIVPVERPPRLLVLGAGPDATPLVEIAGLMNWNVTVIDHRPAYAVAQRFPRAQRVASIPAAQAAHELAATRYDAAVVMSHHLVSDRVYLDALADTDIPYIGLLGPAPRRMRLTSELGAKARRLDGRLYGPVGLDIGARTPETIALSIVSEIQAALAGRAGGSFSGKRLAVSG